MKIIVTAGGTGGHIYPALAIINKFKEKEKNLEVLFIGTHNRMEKEIIPKENINYEELEIYGFNKVKVFKNIKNVFLINKAYKKSLEILKNFKPDVVIGTGGYVTYPVIKAAKKLGIKTFIHEQNSIPGKTNKVLSMGIDLVGVSFQNSGVYFKNAKKVIYSGNPCSSNALKTKIINKEQMGFKKDKKLIIIVAGSLGSQTLNTKFKAFLNVIDKEDFELFYITGKNYYDDFIKDIKLSDNVKVVPYLDNLAGLMKNADLIISRAGASTISEILSLEIPSILIPSPYVANNHQYYNALDLMNLKTSILIEEKNLSVEKLLITITNLFNDPDKYNEMKQNLKNINKESSADLIYNNIKEMI